MENNFSTLPSKDPGNEEHVSLCETLDRVLNKGVVVVGDVFISVAGVDLIYVGLNLVLSSVDRARSDGIAFRS